MCGILLSACKSNVEYVEYDEHLWERLKSENANRGPDAQQTCSKILRPDSSEEDELQLRFFASELQLRGNQAVVQPHQEGGDVFCWNGEIFEGLDLDVSDNDGIKLFSALRALKDPQVELPRLFGTLEGPYAFVYLHNNSNSLYFARDPLGRRSLLVNWPTFENPVLLLTSVCSGAHPKYHFEELSTGSIYRIDLASWASATEVELSKFLQAIPRYTEDDRGKFNQVAKVNDQVPDRPPFIHSLNVFPDELMTYIDGLLDSLSQSVYLRVRDIPFHKSKGQARVAVLFSGGIDSAILAYLADRHLPPDEPIDLLNVAFENPRKENLRVEGKMKMQNKQSQEELKEESILEPQYLPPDRITGLEELEELRRICPSRRWNFVQIDVPFDESSKARSRIEALMYPSRTVMDFSLALALYFASRGVGYVQSHLQAEKKTYESPARVLLDGLGSDELLGGYGRHRTAFNRGGWEAVVKELQLDLQRIPERNLGRDDRVISSHSKETRFPFLSLSVVNYLVQLPINVKMDARLPLGVGDKMLLRLATRKVGMIDASERKKRAMQFGTHSARMEGEKKGDILLS